MKEGLIVHFPNKEKRLVRKIKKIVRTGWDSYLNSMSRFDRSIECESYPMIAQSKEEFS